MLVRNKAKKLQIFLLLVEYIRHVWPGDHSEHRSGADNSQLTVSLSKLKEDYIIIDPQNIDKIRTLSQF